MSPSSPEPVGSLTAQATGEQAQGQNGHAFLDLAKTSQAVTQETTDVRDKTAAESDKQRIERKRLEHERQRAAQRAKFEEQMRQLEEKQQAEELSLLGGTASAPSSPKAGAKSMPVSRRPSGSAGMGGAFGMEKLSISRDEEDVDAEGAQNSVKYLQLNDDDPFPGLPKKEPASNGQNVSTSSAALDLALLSQTQNRAFGSRPFETGLKTSEWPQFSGPPDLASSITSTVSADARARTLSERHAQETAALHAGAPRSPLDSKSPIGMADSVSSLPALPSKSVPGTPYGMASAGLPAQRRSPNEDGGLTQAQRGYSNPDLAKAFNKLGGGFASLEGPRPYGNADPLYSAMALPAINNNNNSSSNNAVGFTPGASGFDSYGFDDDSFGSGALYPGGAMGMKNKRAELDRDVEFNRFTGTRIEDLQGELLSLCKDQHGCRYLQKKLEDGDPAHRDMIFRETYGHFPDLMTDPFGNYLCQKLLEYSTEEQRSAICESVANELVGISLNMHGTRAVQKMIDFLSTPRQPNQIRTIIYALSMNVVSLIKDLNGNHVIQKCLNRLIPEDNQFIYNAIAAHCMEVATHRHGCCVLQRSIDHAADSQRVQLVTEITFNALHLVQDPFGNYVVQYVLDLNDHRFSEAVIRQFVGNVCSLSVQKFSSNVIEKCIRVADPDLRTLLVGELLNRSRLEKLLRDSYGNYVVQTSLDYSSVGQRMLLIELIRPILPSIRNTPYGKRIQMKLQREGAHVAHDPYGGAGYGGQQSMMNLGNMGGYNGGSGNGFGGAGRGGNPNMGGGGGHPRHLGKLSLHHVNAIQENFGPAALGFMGNQHQQPHHRPPHMQPLGPHTGLHMLPPQGYEALANFNNPNAQQQPAAFNPALYGLASSGNDADATYGQSAQGYQNY